jgi:hypothetical protein
VSKFDEALRDLSIKVAGKIEANLIELIVSLFRRDVLVHEVVSPKYTETVDQERFCLGQDKSHR